MVRLKLILIVLCGQIIQAGSYSKKIQTFAQVATQHLKKRDEAMRQNWTIQLAKEALSICPDEHSVTKQALAELVTDLQEQDRSCYKYDGDLPKDVKRIVDLVEQELSKDDSLLPRNRSQIKISSPDKASLEAKIRENPINLAMQHAAHKIAESYSNIKSLFRKFSDTVVMLNLLISNQPEGSSAAKEIKHILQHAKILPKRPEDDYPIYKTVSRCEFITNPKPKTLEEFIEIKRKYSELSMPDKLRKSIDKVAKNLDSDLISALGRLIIETSDKAELVDECLRALDDLIKRIDDYKQIIEENACVKEVIEEAERIKETAPKLYLEDIGIIANHGLSPPGVTMLWDFSRLPNKFDAASAIILEVLSGSQTDKDRLFKQSAIYSANPQAMPNMMESALINLRRADAEEGVIKACEEVYRKTVDSSQYLDYRRLDIVASALSRTYHDDTCPKELEGTELSLDGAVKQIQEMDFDQEYEFATDVVGFLNKALHELINQLHISNLGPFLAQRDDELNPVICQSSLFEKVQESINTYKELVDTVDTKMQKAFQKLMLRNIGNFCRKSPDNYSSNALQLTKHLEPHDASTVYWYNLHFLGLKEFIS